MEAVDVFVFAAVLTGASDAPDETQALQSNVVANR
jgi:hypothetical protein